MKLRKVITVTLKTAKLTARATSFRYPEWMREKI